MDDRSALSVTTERLPARVMDSNKITIFFFLTMGASIALIAYLAFNLQQRSESEVMERFNEYELLKARTIANDLSEFLEARGRGVEALSSYSAFTTSSFEELKNNLDEYAERVKPYFVESLTRYDRNRKVLYSTSPRLRKGSCTSCDFLEWAERPENKEALRVIPLSLIPERSTTIPDTSLTGEHTHQFRILFVKPLYRLLKTRSGKDVKGDYVGALTMTIDLQKLLRNELKFVSEGSQGGNVTLISETGELLLQSFHADNVRRNFLAADHSCYSCHVTFEHDSLMLIQKTGTISYKLKEGQQKIAGFAEIKYQNASWILAVSASKEEVTGFVSRSFLDTFFMLGLIVIVFVGVSLLTYKYYTEKLSAEGERNRLQRTRELEEKVRQSEEQYKRLVEVSPVAMAVHSDGKVVYVNGAAVRLMKASGKEDLIGKSVIEFIHPDSRDVVRARVQQIRHDGGELPPLEEKLIRFDGSVIDVEVAAILLTYEGKSAVQVMVHDVSEWKRSEQAIREQRDNFEALLIAQSEMGIAFGVVDLDARKILFVNDAACKMTGYEREELLRMKSSDFIPEEKRDAARERRSKRRSGESLPDHFETSIPHKDGRRITVDVAMKAVNRDGKELYYAIARDISRRKITEEALQKSEERYRAFVKQSTEGIWRYELKEPMVILMPEEEQVQHLLKHGFLAECNDAMAQMYGYPHAEEIVGKRMSDFLLRSDPGNLGFLRAFVRSKYRLTDAETYEVDTQGRQKFFLNNFVGIVEDGRLVRAWGSQRDVTERKRAEMLLGESEEKYRTLFEESKDVVFISSLSGRFIDVNQAGVELFGYDSKEELLTADIVKDLYINPAERERAVQLIKEHGFLKNFESQARRKDGQPITVLETTAAVRKKDGTVVAMRGIIRDVTAQRQLEEQVHHAQKIQSIATLAGGVAHDFNNILGIILGYVSGFEQAKTDENKQARNIEAIKKAVERGAGLVRQMLTFARKSEPVLESVNVAECLAELTDLLDETFPSNIKVLKNFEATEYTILGDQGQLHQAFLNLCLNARDAMLATTKDNGTILIASKNISGETLRKRYAAAGGEEYLQISFGDTGVGIDEGIRNRIFEPFFTTKELGKGTGLGLSVVYGVVESHGGFIEVESLAKKGTTFHVYLPIDAMESLPVQDAVEHQTLRGEETVLLVEDEIMLLDLLAALMEENGYKVLTAQDGLEAVEVYEKHQKEISLVLSDMGLPKLGGWDALRKMRDINPDVKVILASGYFDPNLKEDMINSGAKDFVQKPYVPELILKRIREVIDGG